MEMTMEEKRQSLLGHEHKFARVENKPKGKHWTSNEQSTSTPSYAHARVANGDGHASSTFHRHVHGDWFRMIHTMASSRGSSDICMSMNVAISFSWVILNETATTGHQVAVGSFGGVNLAERG
jgi:hypothetical protein